MHARAEGEGVEASGPVQVVVRPEVPVLAHTRSGTGEPLILVHGITHRREAWDTVTPFLEKEHDVIAVDLPGHGDSDDVEPDFDGSPAPLVDAVEGLARDLGLERRTWPGTRSAASSRSRWRRAAPWRPRRRCPRPGSGARSGAPGPAA